LYAVYAAVRLYTCTRPAVNKEYPLRDARLALQPCHGAEAGARWRGAGRGWVRVGVASPVAAAPRAWSKWSFRRLQVSFRSDPKPSSLRCRPAVWCAVPREYPCLASAPRETPEAVARAACVCGVRVTAHRDVRSAPSASLGPVPAHVTQYTIPCGNSNWSVGELRLHFLLARAA
jgi:hypothetical protein